MPAAHACTTSGPGGRPRTWKRPAASVRAASSANRLTNVRLVSEKPLRGRRPTSTAAVATEPSGPVTVPHTAAPSPSKRNVIGPLRAARTSCSGGGASPPYRTPIAETSCTPRSSSRPARSVRATT
jgi:hypothetical protein